VFKRTDLPNAERLRRAREVFTPLAQDPGPVRLQSAYFLAVSQVEEKKYDEAIEQFRKITQTPSQGDRDLKVKELANLSLGRVLHEVGRYDEALDAYQEISRESEYFVDSLFEIAWTQVKKGEYARAKDATEILLLMAPDSTLAPEARLLQGHLLLKLQKYEDATATYHDVINNYAPVRDELDALLKANTDPVAYFNNLLARSDRTLDVTSLLPPAAAKWATTQREVSQAIGIVKDLESGRSGAAEGQEIAERILKALDQRGLETFPELQEGYARAEAVDTALIRSEESLIRIEGDLLDDRFSPAQRAELERLRKERADLEAKLADMPANDAAVQARSQRLKDKVGAIDKDAFKLGYEVQNMYAVVSAIDKWVGDTRAERKNTPEDEKIFLGKLQKEQATLVELDKELAEVRTQLAAERDTAAASVSGEDQIRQKYTDILAREHGLFAQAETALGGDAARLLTRAHEIRARLTVVRGRVDTARSSIREQVHRRGEEIRRKVLAEQSLLQGYAGEVATVSGDARDLVGRIAFDSIQRVRQQFYDLVLKADVGLVDVSFTRKQDKTTQIQDLSQKKDHELRELDQEFKEVLKDVD
jgi:tetratricopeptide (TPR) repeat protein